jgi:hypothetical protein
VTQRQDWLVACPVAAVGVAEQQQQQQQQQQKEEERGYTGVL